MSTTKRPTGIGVRFSNSHISISKADGLLLAILRCEYNEFFLPIPRLAFTDTPRAVYFGWLTHKLVPGTLPGAVPSCPILAFCC